MLYRQFLRRRRLLFGHAQIGRKLLSITTLRVGIAVQYDHQCLRSLPALRHECLLWDVRRRQHLQSVINHYVLYMPDQRPGGRRLYEPGRMLQRQLRWPEVRQGMRSRRRPLFHQR